LETPVTFPSVTPNFEIPLLFAGQAQREFTINQAFSIIDSGMRRIVSDSATSPPADAEEGAGFRVASPASGDWVNHEDHIAIRIGGAWHFIAPFKGMVIFDQKAAVNLHYDQAWQQAPEPASAEGGSTVDIEARQMLLELIGALRIVGIFPNPS
jgi:hypothetical protein